MDLSALNEGRAAAARTGIPYAEALVSFADAIVARDPGVISQAREVLAAAAGRDSTCDAAAIASNFQRMVRIADGCGIPLDAPMQALGGPLRRELGLDRFAAAAHTPPAGLRQRIAAPLYRVAMPWLGRLMSSRARRRGAAP